MSSKEKHAAAVAIVRARAVKQEYIRKGLKADTWSDTKPAYAYTSLCSDQRHRKPPARKKVKYEA